MAASNELRISRRKRAALESAKIAAISRAKRSCCMRMLARCEFCKSITH
jgi:hypothetical protein